MRTTPSGLHVAEAKPVTITLDPGRFTEHGKRLQDRIRGWRDMIDRGMPPMLGAASLSDAWELKILDHLTNKAANTSVTGYLALCTSVPTDASTGTTIVEATYTGYARVNVPAASWGAASGTTPAQSSNTTAVTFAACTGSTSTIIGWAYCDALTVGNVIMWGTCTSTVISTTQTPATVAIGALVFQLD